jgi:glycerol-3-phosphate O-acyltransferase
MDIMGNFVDNRGRSFDRYGNEIDIKEYFTSRKEINEDRQREEEYTRLLAEKVVERYACENVVLCSHLVAYAVFEMLLHEHPKLDIFGILRLPHEDYVFPHESLEVVVEQMQKRLFIMEEEGKIKLAPEMKGNTRQVLVSGVENLGIYHAHKPLSFTKEGDIVSSNFRVLYFYHNRLENYNLDKAVTWKNVGIEKLKD